MNRKNILILILLCSFFSEAQPMNSNQPNFKKENNSQITTENVLESKNICASQKEKKAQKKEEEPAPVPTKIEKTESYNFDAFESSSEYKRSQMHEEIKKKNNKKANEITTYSREPNRHEPHVRTGHGMYYYPQNYSKLNNQESNAYPESGESYNCPSEVSEEEQSYNNGREPRRFNESRRKSQISSEKNYLFESSEDEELNNEADDIISQLKKELDDLKKKKENLEGEDKSNNALKIETEIKDREEAQKYWTDAKDELITRLVDIFYFADRVVKEDKPNETFKLARGGEANDTDNLRPWLELCTVEQLACIAGKVEEIIENDISSIYTNYICFRDLDRAKAVLRHIFNRTQFNVDPFLEAILERNKSSYPILDEKRRSNVLFAGVLIKVFEEKQAPQDFADFAERTFRKIFEKHNYSAADFLRYLNHIELEYGENGDPLLIKQYFQEEPCSLKATAYTALTMLGAKEILSFVGNRYGERITRQFSAVAAKVPAIQRAIQPKWSYRLNQSERERAKTVLFSSCFAGGSVLWYRSLMKTNAAELKRELQRVEDIQRSLKRALSSTSFGILKKPLSSTSFGFKNSIMTEEF